jgi:sortase A
VVGDEIVIWEGDDRFVYEVSETETVHSTAIQVTYPTSDPILTLLTCTNWDFDRGVFADRLIIRAVPIERPTG